MASYIRSHLLLPSEQIVICSPKLPERGPPLRTVADLKNHTLLYSSLRPNAWPRWFETAGIKAAEFSNSIAFETSALAYEAAVEGMGVALGEIALISEDVKTGRLIAPFKIYHPNPESFYLLYPKKIESGAGPQRVLRLGFGRGGEEYIRSQDASRCRLTQTRRLRNAQLSGLEYRLTGNFPGQRVPPSDVQHNTKRRGSYHATTPSGHAYLRSDRLDPVTVHVALFAGDAGRDCNPVD
jgi:hypothetical protein